MINPIKNGPIEDVLEERAKQHGSFAGNSRITQHVKEYYRGQSGWHNLTPIQRQTLDAISDKISRILSGNPNEPDHWRDIAGYATLALKETEQ